MTLRGRLPKDPNLNFSSSLLAGDFDPHVEFDNGLKVNPVILSFDYVQGILAVAAYDGVIKVYGKDPIERAFQQPSKLPVKFLRFFQNEGKLVSIDGRDKVYLWDLVESKLVGSSPPIMHLEPGKSIRAVEILPSSPWLFMGLDDGSVTVFDPVRSLLSAYSIPCLAKDEDGSVAVIALQGHPEVHGLLLIGYESGTVALWDLKKKKAVHVIPKAHEGPTLLTSMCWHPSGRVFATAYESGRYAIWDASSVKAPLFHGFVDTDAAVDPNSSARVPIIKLKWYISELESHLLIAGGYLDSDRRGYTVLNFGGTNTVDLKPKKPGIIHFDEIVLDFELTSNSPWFHGAKNPTGLITLFTNGLVEAHELQTPAFNEIELPTSISLYNSPIVSVHFVMFCPEQVTIDFELSRKKVGGNPVQGGKVVDAFRTSYHDLIFTAHENGRVLIWDVVGMLTKLLGSFETRTKADDSGARITKILFDQQSKNVVISKSDGQLLHFQFHPGKYDPAAHSQPTPLPDSSTQDVAVMQHTPLPILNQSHNASAPSADPAAPATPAPPQVESVSSPPLQADHPSMSPKGSTMSKAAGKIISALSFSGRSHHKHPPVPQFQPPANSAADASSQPNQAEGAGASSAPPSSDPSPASSNPTSPAANPRELSEDNPPTKRLPSYPSTSSLEEMGASLPNSPALVGERRLNSSSSSHSLDKAGDNKVPSSSSTTLQAVVDRYTHLVPGFQPNFRFSFHKAPISALAMSHNWKIIVAGDRDGVLSITNFLTTHVIYSKNFSEKNDKRCGITCVYFTFSYSHSDSLSPLLLVGTEDGAIHTLVIKKTDSLLELSEVHTIKPKIASRPVYLVVLDEFGQEVEAVPPLDTRSPGPHYLVTVHEKQLRVHVNNSAKGKYSKVAFEDGRTILRATVVEKGAEQVCLAVLFSDGLLNFYTLPDLTLIDESKVFEGLEEASLRSVTLSKYGKGLLQVGKFELQRFTVWSEVSRIDWTKFLGIPHKEGVVFPEAPSSGLSNLFGLLKGSHPSELNPLFEEESKKTGPRPVPTTDTLKKSERDQLFEGNTRKTDLVTSKPTEVKYSSPAVREALAKTQKNLAERGQKISELGEKTHQMENDAMNFADMARALREREEKKKWYEF